MHIVADIHTHTIASGHAYGTIREMAQAASEKKLSVLGITEHAPGVPGTTDPFYYLCLNLVPKTLFGVRVIHGCEINILNDGTLSLEERFMIHLNYAIAGIHTTCYQDAGKLRNTENIISAMKHPLVKLISHPDDDHTPLDYEMLAEAALETGTALELNSSSLLKPEHRMNCFENYRTMLECCRRLKVPVIVSSDAHDPSAVGCVDPALKLLESVSFPEELILNTDEQKLLDFLLSPSR